MVKLNKIYTKTGDDGKTTLVNGERVDKHSCACCHSRLRNLEQCYRIKAAGRHGRNFTPVRAIACPSYPNIHDLQ